MSYRELRNLCEGLRSLGYPRLVSVDNFRTPNFGLVADILYWLIHRYEPSATISDNISTEDLRVAFISTAVQVMWSKGAIKLKPKNLYAADGRAVKELLKVSDVLYKAQKVSAASSEGGVMPASFGSAAKISDMKATRELATEITESGAKLYDLLEEEKDLSVARARALRFLDAISNNLNSNKEHEHIETCVRDAVREANESADALERQGKEFEIDLKALRVKIKKKQSELERSDKRLKSLQNVRPAFMDEYEQLEIELQAQYEVYLERFRNLDFLEHEMDKYNQAEKDEMDERNRALKRMQKRLREEELRILRGEQEVDDDHFGMGDKPSSGFGQGGGGEPQSDGGRNGFGSTRRRRGNSGVSDDSDDSISDVSDSGEDSFSGSEDDDSMLSSDEGGGRGRGGGGGGHFDESEEFSSGGGGGGGFDDDSDDNDF